MILPGAASPSTFTRAQYARPRKPQPKISSSAGAGAYGDRLEVVVRLVKPSHLHVVAAGRRTHGESKDRNKE
ncbi:hypothetical protein IQ26_06646 [Mesorhizobium tianshanense]|uniref:Uncharacterized protein n=1 Tax=Mesorhizobium tianshanense TaxID=39844 RepID=A0A562MSP9_9HYPH|nr:hypothetical protein IQ26_06646 [Mesorhizobium tianshanense]